MGENVGMGGEEDGNLPPPPNATYDNKEEMLESIRAFARNHGYAIHVRRSDKGRITYKCDRLDFFLVSLLMVIRAEMVFFCCVNDSEVEILYKTLGKMILIEWLQRSRSLLAAPLRQKRCLRGGHGGFCAPNRCTIMDPGSMPKTTG